MDFDDFKNEWKGMKAPEKLQESSQNSIAERILKMNRKILLSNIIGSMALASTMPVLGYIWNLYPDRSPFFYGGIIAVMAIAFAAIGAMWWRTLFWKTIDFSQNTRLFLSHSLKKLYRSRWMRKRFMPAYNLLLYLAIMCYTIDLTLGVSIEWKIGLLTGNTLFIAFITWITYRTSRPKARELDNLIADLEEAQATFESQQ